MLIPKTLVIRLKSVLPSLILPNRNAYVKNLFISESGILILDILELSNDLSIDGFLLTVDIE